MRNINALMIPAEYLTKVFISHLHTDHWGDLNALWAGGWTSGRPVSLVHLELDDAGDASLIGHLL